MLVTFIESKGYYQIDIEYNRTRILATGGSSLRGLRFNQFRYMG